MLDTKGPEIRTGNLRDEEPVTFEEGQEIDILTDYKLEGDDTRLTCSYQSLPKTVKPGDTVVIDEGAMTCEVKECFEDSIKVICKNTATIGQTKSINLPGCNIDLPTLTEDDEKDILDFGLKHGIDFVAASFIRKPSDVEYVRDVLGQKGQNVKVIAKIENQEGLKNYEGILDIADGILVARGDLSREINPEKAFLAQKRMIEKANLKAKPVITATQMIDSMCDRNIPARGETADIANSVLDGTDCLLLSQETSDGNFPVEAVKMVALVATEAEKIIDYQRIYDHIQANSGIPTVTAESIANTAASSALNLNIQLIVVLSDTGRIARFMAKYRPRQTIFACTSSPSVAKQMNLLRGVVGYKMPEYEDQDNIAFAVLKSAKSMGLCEVGQKVIVIQSSNEEQPDETNVLNVLDVE